jgi:hypothetical protein
MSAVDRFDHSDYTHVIESKAGSKMTLGYFTEIQLSEWLKLYSKSQRYTLEVVDGDEYTLTRDSTTRKGLRFHVYPKAKHLCSCIL